MHRTLPLITVCASQQTIKCKVIGKIITYLLSVGQRIAEAWSVKRLLKPPQHQILLCFMLCSFLYVEANPAERLGFVFCAERAELFQQACFQNEEEAKKHKKKPTHKLTCEFCICRNSITEQYFSAASCLLNHIQKTGSASVYEWKLLGSPSFLLKLN